jgi:hypothetical protein
VPRAPVSMVPARRVGPGQALWRRRIDAPTPAAFCAALLGKLRYALHADVPAATWRVALRYFAERQLPEREFRRLLEQRAERTRAATPLPGAAEADTGARVAAYLLREWEQYRLARRLAPTGPGRGAGGRVGAPRQRPARRASSQDRASQVAWLQRLGLPVPPRRPTGQRPARPRPPTPPEATA